MQYIINTFNVLNISKTFCVLYTGRRVPARRGFAENGQVCQACAVWRPQADRLFEPSGEFRPACPAARRPRRRKALFFARSAGRERRCAVFRAERWAGTPWALFFARSAGRERRCAYMRSGAFIPSRAKPFLMASLAAITRATLAAFSSSLSVRMCSSW